MEMTWNATVVTLEDGDLALEFTPESIQELGWAEGDTLTWKDLGDGTWSLTKKENT